MRYYARFIFRLLLLLFLCLSPSVCGQQEQQQQDNKEQHEDTAATSQNQLPRGSGRRTNLIFVDFSRFPSRLSRALLFFQLAINAGKNV